MHKGHVPLVVPSNHSFHIGNFNFEAYFEVLYLLWVVDFLRTLNVHHCLSLVITDCPRNHSFSG